jgi:LysR family hydrogen peroxide-inducible transcriptional activator
MNIRDLRYLVALADTRHFGQAAEKCHVSQPTLSAQIRKLEEYLGVTLVERQPKRVALTAEGELVVERARRLVKEADDILQLARGSRDPLSGRLKIGLIPTVGPYLLPRVAPKLRRKLTRLQLLLFEYQTGPLLERLRNGDIDLGILALPVNLEGLDSRPLYDEPFMVAVPDKHPLASNKVVKPADLSGETLLLLEDGHCLRDQALEVCSRLDVHEESDFRATSLETLRQMVGAGLGITLLPQLAAEGPFASTRGLAVRPFARPVPVRTIGAVWRRSSTRVPAIHAVCEVIAESHGA